MRCLLGTQVEMLHRQVDMQVWTLGKVGAGDINVGVISDYIKFQARTRRDPWRGGAGGWRKKKSQD